MLNNKERRNKMINRHKETNELLNKPGFGLSIQQKITKAKSVFVWVIVYDGDGEYVETSKAKLVNALRSHPEALDESKFVLREDGDLYVN
tara:strand:- start:264 stop:533 length:270 start_codon:yes stop_codon:yes gene_type:complete